MRLQRVGRDGDFSARRLCFILDSGSAGVEHSLTVAERVLSGGCRFIQVREKSMSDRDRLALLRLVIDRARTHDAWVVANDRVDLAILAGACGVHLGQSDLALADARSLFSACGRDNVTIGLSAHSKDEALLAQSEGANYLGCGAVFSTGTKQNAAKLGLDGLATIADSVEIPVFGIGGVSLDRVGDVLSAGAFGVAVCSAIVNAPDPARATRDFITAIDRAS